MPLLLVRSIRLGSWDQQQIDNICKVEFGLDEPFAISVYECSAAETVQIYAEHRASDKIPREPRNGDIIDASGLPWPVAASLGDTLFPFTQNRHREIAIVDQSQLRTFVGQLVGSFSSRVRKITKAQIKAHVRAAHAAGDKVWADVCASRSSWAKLLTP
jgi:hypothetical protein